MKVELTPNDIDLIKALLRGHIMQEFSTRIRVYRPDYRFGEVDK